MKMILLTYRYLIKVSEQIILIFRLIFQELFRDLSIKIKIRMKYKIMSI